MKDKNNNSNLEEILAEITIAINAANYNDALLLYSEVYRQWPEYLSPATEVSLSKSQATHIHNVGNLARRDLFAKTQSIGTTDRLKKAVRIFCGAEKKQFDKAYQSPSFLYVPNLPSAPFFDVNSVQGLNTYVNALSEHKDVFISQLSQANERYIHDIGDVPDTEEWAQLAQKWNSLHLMKGGKLTEHGSKLPSEIKALFESPILAHCPVHAPEIVISVLQPKTKIPPHFGISNIKWTLHIPLVINDKSYLNVANEKMYWHENTTAILFDDSFQHSAENGDESARAVLIMDIWNPHLTTNERADIAQFIAEYSEWSSQYGELATLDRRLYK